jgi:hypothetical protein
MSPDCQRRWARLAQRRGRRSHDDYMELAIALIRADIWTLKDQKTFADAIGVKALVAQFAGEAWPLGIALHLLIAGAVADVYSVAAAAQTRAATRISEFLRLWYYEHRTVSSAAIQMHLSRSHIAKTIQRPALLLVAQRFLALTQTTDPASQSEGLQRVVHTFTRHEWSADPEGSRGLPRRAPLPPALSA